MTTTARTSSTFQADPHAPAVEPLRLVHPVEDVVFLTARCPWLWRILLEVSPVAGSAPWLRPQGPTDHLLLTVGVRQDWRLHVQAGPSPAAGRTPDTTPKPLARLPEAFLSVEIAALAEGRHAWASLAHFADPAGCPLDLAVAYGLSHQTMRLGATVSPMDGGSCSLQTPRGVFACRAEPSASTSDGYPAFDGPRLTWSDPVPRMFDLHLTGGESVGLSAMIERDELIHALTGTAGRLRVVAARMFTDVDLRYTRPRCSFLEAARYV